ncbi:conserved hypothetical protein, partial [Ricinus communis]
VDQVVVALDVRQLVRQQCFQQVGRHAADQRRRHQHDRLPAAGRDRAVQPLGHAQPHMKIDVETARQLGQAALPVRIGGVFARPRMVSHPFEADRQPQRHQRRPRQPQADDPRQLPAQQVFHAVQRAIVEQRRAGLARAGHGHGLHRAEIAGRVQVAQLKEDARQRQRGTQQHAAAGHGVA